MARHRRRQSEASADLSNYITAKDLIPQAPGKPQLLWTLAQVRGHSSTECQLGQK